MPAFGPMDAAAMQTQMASVVASCEANAATLASLIGAPLAKTVAFATAYQAANPARPAQVSILVDLAITISVGTPQANTVELWIATTSAAALAGSMGTLADSYRADLTVTLISLGFTSRAKLTAILPVGYYFAVRRTVGAGITVSSAYEQAIG